MQLSITVVVSGGPDGGGQDFGHAIPHPVAGNVFSITRDVLAQLSGAPSDDIVGCNVAIECKDAIVTVSGIKYCSFAPFANQTAHVAHLTIDGCSKFCRVCEMTVGRADFERSNSLLVDSRVEQLNIGIRTARDAATANPPVETSEVWTDIRGSEVGLLRVFVRQERVDARRSLIRHLVIEPDTRVCTKATFTEGNAIERLSLSGSVKELTLKGSNITDMYLAALATITTLSLNHASIVRMHNGTAKTFANKTLDTWSLVQESARWRNDEGLHAEAGYKAMEAWRKQEKWWWRFPYLFLRFTCGYGYRPQWTVVLALAVMLGCGLGYWSIWDANVGALSYPGASDNPPTPPPEGIERFYSCVYMSVITFTTTGYGDMVPKSNGARALAGTEALAGIVLTALFIFALTKRFGSLR